MEQQYEYKEEIINSRLGYLGGSDYSIFSKVEAQGQVPESCKERLAICKGLYKKENKFSTQAMQLGDDIENNIFDMLHSADERWQSNPRIESKKFKRNNIGLLCHPDFILVDEDKKLVTFVECKATKDSFSKTRKTYNGQLYIENILGKEYTEQMDGSGWRFNLKLCHYDTSDYIGEFNPDKIEMSVIRFGRPPFNISKCMDIIDKYMEELTEYYREEITQEYLPQKVQEKFDAINSYLREIKEKEDTIKEFKDKMFEFMLQKNIKAIKTDSFTLSRVDECDSRSFDTSSFKEDHKTLYNKYIKVSRKKGYARLVLKGEK